MRVTSSGVENGVILDRFGGRGTEFNENQIPTRSLPFQVWEAPEHTKSFALVLEDKDAYPVTGGFVWIHWLAADITRWELLENESRTAKDFVQGANSWMSSQGGEQSRELSSFYGGMTPPDKDHLYELHVFALDTILGLSQGFYLNELYHAMENHILDSFTLKGIYKKL